MANRKPYVVNVLGIEHTMLLDERDVKRYGDRARPADEPDPTPDPADDRAPSTEGDVDEDDLEDDELEDELDEDVEEPAKNASLAAWQEFARLRGADESDLDGMTRDQLRDAYGS